MQGAKIPLKNVVYFSRNDLRLLMLISDLVRFDQLVINNVNCGSPQTIYENGLLTISPSL